MDKKMLNKILGGAAALFGLVALIMLFVAQVKADAGIATVSYKGMDITFGKKETIMGIKGTLFKFSFMNLLTYIFVIVGIVCAILAVLGKGGNITAIVAAAAFVLAAIFFFCAVQFTIPGGGKMGDAKDVFKLGAGAIVGGVMSILAAGCAVGKIFVKE